MNTEVKIDKILLDMDGVIVNNMKDLADREGMTVDWIIREKNRLKAEDENFDFVVHLIRRHLYTGQHFAECQPLPHLDVFKKFIRQWLKNGIKVEILSSACSGPDIYDEICRQKEIWLAKHGLDILPTNFSRGSREKHHWARPNVLLIDDYGKNCEAFRSAGGHAVKFESVPGMIVSLEEYGLV